MEIQASKCYLESMATQKSRKPRASQSLRVSRGIGGSKVKFGSVEIIGDKPSAAAIKHNVERSTEALERIAKKLVRPGVIIRAKKNVPRFWADENEPGVYIRKLNGRTQRGRLVDGSFRAID